MADQHYRVKVSRTPMGGALWTVAHADGTSVAWSLYWNGPGARLQLGFRPTDPDGMLTSISAPGYDGPIDTFAAADKLARAFVGAES